MDMTAEIENNFSQKLMNVNENYEKQLQRKENDTMNIKPLLTRKKTSKDRFKKVRDKYTLRKNSQKIIEEIYIAKTIRNQDIIPAVPKKVLRIISILRHRDFLKAVRKYFKVAPEEIVAWNFGNSNGVHNDDQTRRRSSSKISEEKINNTKN